MLLPFALAFFVSLLGLAIAIALHQSRWLRLPRRALLVERDPRRSRALARLLARGRAPVDRTLLAMVEANALLWEGEHARAIALLDTRVIPARVDALGILPVVIKLECLLFDERHEEARALFDEHVAALRSTRPGLADVEAISGFLQFYEGALDKARGELERALGHAPSRDPIRRAVHFCLAAIAHRQERAEDTRRHLAHAIRNGGDLFVAGWAADRWEALFPRDAMPASSRPRDRRRAPGALRSLPHVLWIGLQVLFFRTAALRARTFTLDQVVLLVLLDVLVVIGLRFVDYTPASMVHWRGVVAVAAPIPFFLLTAHLAATARGGDGRIALRLLAGFYGALPLVLGIMFVSIGSQPRFAYLPGALELGAGAWLLAVVARLLQSVARRAGVVRILACVAVFAATWIVPMFAVGHTRVSFAPPPDFADYEAEQRRHDQLVFDEADRAHAAEATLAAERPGMTDLYFVGAAGWADQDVFARELHSARRLFDERFDTGGRSIVLSNESHRDGALPLAALPTLRHVLDAVGRRMNHEEDVLFLFVTSHGSREGLALRPPRRAAFDSETLSPVDLRSMLDSSGIKWRVLVISGCESGVFIDVLRNEHTLIATAAASDRSSYGCAMGNSFTDFGRAVFEEQLVHERSFSTAFRNAAQVIEKRETDGDLRASRPQIAEGSAIRAKLRELEGRLSATSVE